MAEMQNESEEFLKESKVEVSLNKLKAEIVEEEEEEQQQQTNELSQTGTVKLTVVR